MYFIPFFLDFAYFLVYSIQAIHNLPISCQLCYVCRLSLAFVFFHCVGGASSVTIYALTGSRVNCSYRYLSVIFLWAIGLFAGVCISFACKPHFSLMLSVFYQPVSIVGLLACIYLPLFVSYVSIISHNPIWFFAICLFKAIAFGFCCGFISSTYHTAAWLIRYLFLFSDGSFLFWLLWLWLRFYDLNQESCRHLFFTCCFVGAIIAVVDYFVISPFLVGIL